MNHGAGNKLWCQGWTLGPAMGPRSWQQAMVLAMGDGVGMFVMATVLAMGRDVGVGCVLLMGHGIGDGPQCLR